MIEVGSNNLRPVSDNSRFSDPSTWEAENAFVIISHRKIWTEAERYRNYRNTRFNTVLVDIEVLYDQFSYGIRKHPLAIRNFADYMLTAWTSDPSHFSYLESDRRAQGEKEQQFKSSELDSMCGLSCF